MRVLCTLLRKKPLRTLVADTDMSIKVGVAIGGKREVHTDDWATFEIDPSLLDGTGSVSYTHLYVQEVHLAGSKCAFVW